MPSNQDCAVLRDQCSNQRGDKSECIVCFFFENLCSMPTKNQGTMHKKVLKNSSRQQKRENMRTFSRKALVARYRIKDETKIIERKCCITYAWDCWRWCPEKRQPRGESRDWYLRIVASPSPTTLPEHSRNLCRVFLSSGVSRRCLKVYTVWKFWNNFRKSPYSMHWVK